MYNGDHNIVRISSIALAQSVRRRESVQNNTTISRGTAGLCSRLSEPDASTERQYPNLGQPYGIAAQLWDAVWEPLVSRCPAELSL